MGKSVNKTILLGNVGKDPEFKVLPAGTSAVTFSMATTQRYKDRTGEWQEQTEWHNLVAYGKTADVIRDYVKKGNKLFIEGRLATRSWDDKESGKKVYRTEIVVNDLTLLGSNGDQSNRSAATSSKGNNNQSHRQHEKEPGRNSEYSQNPPEDYVYSQGTEITDDDIPF